MAMTDEAKLAMLKQMLDPDDPTSDEVLSTYLTLAGSKIIAKAYPYRSDVTEVPVQYETLQLEIAAYLLNKRGAEGQVTHTENGVQRQYENGDVPVSLLRTIVPHVGVIA